MKGKTLLILLSICAMLYPASILSQTDPAHEWDLLYLKIRDRLIPKHEAQEELKTVEASLKLLSSRTMIFKLNDRLCFPLKGYGPSAIGGREGSGYQTFGYDFFDGNQHKGHPGHDIFIRDKNQDCLDDSTGMPVEVVSASAGIVVSVNERWEPSSPVRGGNYVWIFEPRKTRYYYYAHLGEIFVRVGQVVSQGERLGRVGRTGANAYPKRSPTHLHFAVHQSKDGYPRPINPFKELVNSGRANR